MQVAGRPDQLRYVVAPVAIETCVDFYELLVRMGTATFIRDYYLRIPMALPGSVGAMRHLGSWDELEVVLNSEGPSVLLVRDGAPQSFPPPTCAGEAKALVAEGMTVVVRHAERHSPRIEQLSACAPYSATLPRTNDAGSPSESPQDGLTLGSSPPDSRVGNVTADIRYKKDCSF